MASSSESEQRNFEEELKNLEKNCANFMDRIDEKRGRLKENRGDVVAVLNKYRGNKKRIPELKQQVEQKKLDSSSLQSKIKELETKKAEIAKKTENLEQQVTSANNKISELQEKLIDVQTNANRQKEPADDNKERLIENILGKDREIRHLKNCMLRLDKKNKELAEIEKIFQVTVRQTVRKFIQNRSTNRPFTLLSKKK